MKEFHPLHPTKGYSLGLFFSNLVVDVVESINALVRTDDHHLPAVLSFEPGIRKTIKYDRIVYNFKEANVPGIAESLNAVNWVEVLAADDVDANVAAFYNVLDGALQNNVPLMRLKTSNFPAWCTSELKSWYINSQ